jgi:hypothetical protein
MGNQTSTFRNAAELWDEVRLPTKSSRDQQRWMRKAFARVHPNGHLDSIKEDLANLFLIRLSGSEIPYPSQHLNQIHSRAWPLLLEHGKDYRPKMIRGRGLRDSSIQPTDRECYLNSAKLMRDVNTATNKSVTYVEGCVCGPKVWMQLHAWNGAGFSHHAFDWTFYPVTNWCRYFGVPFSEEEYIEIVRLGQKERPIGLLFDVETFPIYEKEIQEVLKRPRTRLHRR